MTFKRKPVNLLSKSYQLFWAAVDWLYPPYCGGCGVFGTRWCDTCKSDVKVIGENCCIICGDLLPDGGICSQCKSKKPPFTGLRSWAIHQGALRDAIHSLKYQGNMALGEVFSQPLSNFLKNLGWDFDMIVPIPLNERREKERGYNQAALLAFPISIIHRKRYSQKAVVRSVDTKSQVGLTLQERTENVHSAFQANPLIVKGKKILLIDDVATSGATMSETAKALLDAGASLVYGMTLSRAVFSQTKHGLKSACLSDPSNQSREEVKNDSQSRNFW